MKIATLLVLVLAWTAEVLSVDPPYGWLRVEGNKLKGQNGQNVQLRGMSLFWSSFMAQFYNRDVIRAIKCSWNSNVVRIPMGVDNPAQVSGNNQDPSKAYMLGGAEWDKQINLVDTVVQACIDNGIYAVIDWHAHFPHQAEAIRFFERMAQKWGRYPNVLYEVFNEPKPGWSSNWNGVLVPYHKAVIQAIRKYDQKNIIILGTPNWSSIGFDVINNPIRGYNNIMYTLHFYAATGSHAQNEGTRSVAQQALDKGLAIFVTEYGTVEASGDGNTNAFESDQWWKWLDQRQISYANWAMGANWDPKREPSALAVLPLSPANFDAASNRLTANGQFVQNRYRTQNNGVRC